MIEMQPIVPPTAATRQLEVAVVPDVATATEPAVVTIDNTDEICYAQHVAEVAWVPIQDIQSIHGNFPLRLWGSRHTR